MPVCVGVDVMFTCPLSYTSYEVGGQLISRCVRNQWKMPCSFGPLGVLKVIGRRYACPCIEDVAEDIDTGVRPARCNGLVTQRS